MGPVDKSSKPMQISFVIIILMMQFLVILKILIGIIMAMFILENGMN